MNKIITIFIAVLCAGLQAGAQNTHLNPAALEMDKAGAVWFNTDNAAGVILTPTVSFETVDVGYDITDGDYRRYADGNSRILGVNAEGATRLGKAWVWGEFNYSNITVNDSKFNTVFLNMDDDMPFYAADDIEGYWKKQRYDLSMKAATPLIKDRFAFGISAGYFSESGAKQVDPRGYGYEYGLYVYPSAVVRFGKHTAGLTLTYDNGNMRMSSINNAIASSKLVYVMKGLGNADEYFVSLISSSALGLVYDKKHEFGASLQYNFLSGGNNILVELFCKSRNWELFMTPSRPYRIGTASRMSIGFNTQALLAGTDYLQVIKAVGSLRNIKGIEYIQKLNLDPGIETWEVVGQNVKSTYCHVNASLGYDIYRKSGNSYDWAAGAEVSWNNLDDEYFLPSSTMAAGYLSADAFVKKNFGLGKMSLVPGAALGYKKGLESNYVFGGEKKDTSIITDLFPNTLAWMGADHVKCGLNITASMPAFKSGSVYMKADWQLLKAFGAMTGTRNIASVTLGFIF